MEQPKKYIKVNMNERLPQASGNYWIQDVVGDMKSSYYNATLKSFPAYDFVEFWMDSVPDRESELIEMLERIIAFTSLGERVPDFITHEAESLIQSVKQPK